MLSIRSLLDDLSVLLQKEDVLDERKALPVGTISTYSNGSKWKKLKSGKWRKLKSKSKSKKSKKSNSGSSKAASIKAKIAKKAKLANKMAKIAKMELSVKKSKLLAKADLSISAAPSWYQRESPNDKKRQEKAIKDFKNKGFSEEEATYAAASSSDWAASSVSRGAAHLRGAMSAIVGRSLEEEKSALKGALKSYKGHDSPPDDGTEMTKAFKGSPPPNSKVVKTALAKMAKISQKAYKKDTVVLYRGVDRNLFQDAEKSGALKVGMLSSWSESPDIARTFTGNSSKKGGVLRVEVPRKQVAMSYRACPSLLQGEKEVVLACKGAIKVKVWKGEDRDLDNYVTIELEDGVELEVSNESEEEAADGYDDWMRKFRKQQLEAETSPV